MQSDPSKAYAKLLISVLTGLERWSVDPCVPKSNSTASFLGHKNWTDLTLRENVAFLLRLLQYGAPHHGGLAFGLDRLVTFKFAGAESHPRCNCSFLKLKGFDRYC